MLVTKSVTIEQAQLVEDMVNCNSKFANLTNNWVQF